MKYWRNAAIVVFLAAYLAAFYLTSPRDGIGQPTTNETGERLSRIEVLLPILLRPEEWLLPNWFGDTIQIRLTDRLPILMLAAVILGWAAAIGWLALEFFGITRGLTRMEKWVFSFAVGLGTLSTWTLLLGLFGCLNRPWLCWVPGAATGMLALLVWYRPDRVKGNGVAQQEDSERPSDFSLRWLYAALPFVAMIFLAAMLPPLDFDVCEYHLQAPKEFFQQGRVTFLPHNVYANMAMGTEMLSLLAMVLAGDWGLGALVGKTVIAAFTPLCALALLAAGRRWHSNQAGIVAALLYISVPWIVSVSSGGLVEGALACYLFLAVYALLLTRSATPLSPPRLYALSGYLAGCAVATKYPAVLFVLLPLAFWALASQSPRTSMRYAVRVVAVFLLAAAVGCGLWFGKNWALTGNPTYPLLYSVFGGKSWNAEKDAQWNRVHRPHDFSPTTLAADAGRVVLTSTGNSPILIPLAALAFLACGTAACKSRTRGEQRHADVASKTAAISNASPELFLERPSGTAWALLGYAAFVVVAWWCLTHRIDRFWVPVLPVLALLAGVGSCWSAERWWRRVLAGLLALGLSANFLIASAAPGNAWFVGLDQLRDDPRWTNPWHWYLNNDPKAGAVLTVGDAAVFDLKSPLFYNTCFDDCVFQQLVKGKTAQGVREAFAARKIGYVFVNWGEIERYRNTYGFTDFVQPKVFEWLVSEGILQPIEPLKDRPEQAYRVVPAAPSRW